MVHSFPSFELDEDRFELRRDGQPVKIEPRVLELLAYLVRNRGRIVTKEELLDQVWKKTFVSESALTRGIMEARRAIGSAELIKTVHGRGYRFESPDRPESPELPDPPAVLAEPVRETVAHAASRRPGHATLALPTMVLALAFGGWLFGRHMAPEDPHAIVTARVALLPIAMNEDDRELQMVGMTIADLLEQRLDEVENLRVRGADYSGPISVSAASLAEVARRAGVDSIISGDLAVTPSRDRVRLALVLHQIGDDGSVRDTPLGSHSLPLLERADDIRQYAAFRERVVSRVVTTLLPALRLRQEGAPMPRTPESYRLYLLARERLAAGGCDGEAAVELLRRSLEIDDRFAPAWNAYAWALYRLASSCTGGASQYATALAAAERALSLAPDLGSAVALQARIMAETGRVAEAYALLRTAARNNPADADLNEAQFAILAQAGFLAPAQQHLQHAKQADANLLAEHGAVPTPLLYAGEWNRFLESLPESDAPRFRFARGFAELMRGRADVAHRALEPSFRSNPSDAYARLSHALLAVIEGRHDEARAIVRHFVRHREAVRESDPEMTYRIAQLAALAGDEALAQHQLERAIAQGFFCVALIERDRALDSIRDTAHYAQALTRAAKRHREFGTRFGLPRSAQPAGHVALTAER